MRCVLNAPPTVGVVLTATAPEAPDPFAEPERAAVAPAPLALEAPPPALPVAHLSYSTLESYNRCGYRFYLERVLGLPRVPRSAAARSTQAPRLPALVRGSLAHILLEELDLAAPVDPTDEALDLLAADNDAVLTPEDRDDLRDLVRALRRERGWARAWPAADEVRREAGLLVRHRHRRGRGARQRLRRRAGARRRGHADRRLQDRPPRRGADARGSRRARLPDPAGDLRARRAARGRASRRGRALLPRARRRARLGALRPARRPGARGRAGRERGRHQGRDLPGLRPAALRAVRHLPGPGHAVLLARGGDGTRHRPRRSPQADAGRYQRLPRP